MAIIWVGGVAALAAAGAAGGAWLYRVVMTRRLNAAAQVYAQREIARTRRTGILPNAKRPLRRRLRQTAV
jgi:hypothetical protein